MMQTVGDDAKKVFDQIVETYKDTDAKITKLEGMPCRDDAAEEYLTAMLVSRAKTAMLFYQAKDIYNKTALIESGIFRRSCADPNCKNVFFATDKRKKYCCPDHENRARQRRYRKK
jgi:hypothetical protein